MLGICTVLSVAASSVEWRCSTEGSTWQLEVLPPQNRDHDEAPNPICNPIPNLDCWGNDLEKHTGIRSAGECCNICKVTPQCGAWTYDTTPSHHPFCYVKSACSTTPHNGNVTVVSGRGTPSPPAPPPAPPAVLQIKVNTSDIYHEIEGFGGCFNEKGWDALSVLSDAQKDTVMQDLFSANGLRWGLNRMPIGSSDFADNYYSLDDSAADYTMANLTLARDKEKLLPYIKAAMAVNPDLKVWGSPWTGPWWLKDSAPQAPNNYGCGSLDPSPKKRAAYALYLARAAKAYRAEGLNFEHLAIQNEPNQGSPWNGKSCGNSYPKMHWTGAELAEFLKNHLGPTFEREGIADQVGIFLATFPVNEFENYVLPALSDPDAAKYLSGVGLQYAGVGMIKAIKEKNGALKLWETETPCGGGRARSCGNGPGTSNNSWAWGEGQWSYMRSYLESGASVYSQWNMILDQTGKSGWGWSQCSPVTVNTDTKSVNYEGSYWATKHFSYYIDPGSKMVGTSGDNGLCAEVNGACGCTECHGGGDANQYISFVNPDNSIVIVGLNSGNTPQAVRVAIDGAVVVNATVPAHSFNTFKVPAHSHAGDEVMG